MSERPVLHEIDGKWYNSYNEPVCGATTEHGPCKNTRYCRFHSQFRPEQLKLKSVEKGEWMPEEHQKFLEGILKYGVGHWVEVSNHIQTRQPSQCQVHFFKLREKLGLDPDDFVDFIRGEMERTRKETDKKRKEEPEEETPRVSPAYVEPEKTEYILLPTLKIDSNNSDLLFNASPFLNSYE